MKTLTVKQLDALRIRDAALIVFQRDATWHEVKNGPRMQVCTVGGMSIMVQTPFQTSQLAGPSDASKYLAASLGVQIEKPLPYGLDIWVGKKVMNIEWSDGGDLRITTFKRGDWEAKLIAAAKTEEAVA